MTWTDYPGRTFAGFDPAALQRNGLPPDGAFTRGVAQALNMMMARCGQVIPGKVVLPAQVRDSASDLALWRARYRSGPNGTKLVVRVRLLPTQGDINTPPEPAWYIKVDGVSTNPDGASDPDVHHYVYGTGATLADAFEMERTYTVSAATAHTITLCTKDHCHVLGWNLWEPERDGLVSGTDAMVDYSRILALSPICDADALGAIVTCAAAIHDKMRACHLAWSVDDPASPIAATTTATNIWDGDTGGRSTTTVGATCPTQYRNTYIDDVAATYQIPAVCWVYAERTGGAGNVSVRFVGENGTTTVTVNGAANIYGSTSLTLKPGAGGDKVDVYLITAAGTTGNLYSAGIYQLTGT